MNGACRTGGCSGCISGCEGPGPYCKLLETLSTLYTSATFIKQEIESNTIENDTIKRQSTPGDAAAGITQHALQQTSSFISRKSPL